MGKSSSYSLKKKRSKISSSRARIKKRSKSRVRRHNKSKKLRRRDDPVSYSSDSDNSRSSVSVSSSSSEDEYRSRRSQSRTKDVNGSKNRSRGWSSGEERTENARLKKRKGSKRSKDFEVRKKTNGKKKNKNKKKSKRAVSVSSTSSGSWSCSTCQVGGTGSDESEVEKSRGMSERHNKDRRRLEDFKSGTKRRRSRSRSCSSCGPYSYYKSEEQLTGEVNLRRLRSVITVTREGNEDRGMDKDEMVYDHDDYPPSRSNDSNDGGSKREWVHNSRGASEKKKNEEDEKGEVVVSNVKGGKVTETDKDSEYYNGSNPNDWAGMNDAVKGKKNEDSGAVDSSHAYDLESILRQKALENLRKFRRGHQTDAKAFVNEKDLMDSDKKRMSNRKDELFQNKTPEEGGAATVITSQLAEENSIPTVSKGSSEFLQDDKNLSDGKDGGKDYGPKHDVPPSADRVSLTGSPKQRVNDTFSSVSYKPRLISLASRHKSSDAYVNKQVPALQQEPEAKSMTGNSVADSMVETARTVNLITGKSNDEEVSNAPGLGSDDPSSCPKSISAVISTNKPQDEAKEDSQFEQKTMTVMRGGEMVEVSYKVYIPKKAPALSRRPLKR